METDIYGENYYLHGLKWVNPYAGGGEFGQYKILQKNN